MPFNKQSFVNEESECNKYEDFPIDSRMFLKRKTKSKSVELKTNGSSDLIVNKKENQTCKVSLKTARKECSANLDCEPSMEEVNKRAKLFLLFHKV